MLVNRKAIFLCMFHMDLSTSHTFYGNTVLKLTFQGFLLVCFYRITQFGDKFLSSGINQRNEFRTLGAAYLGVNSLGESSLGGFQAWTIRGANVAEQPQRLWRLRAVLTSPAPSAVLLLPLGTLPCPILLLHCSRGRCGRVRDFQRAPKGRRCSVCAGPRQLLPPFLISF